MKSIVWASIAWVASAAIAAILMLAVISGLVGFGLLSQSTGFWIVGSVGYLAGAIFVASVPFGAFVLLVIAVRLGLGRLGRTIASRY